MWSYPATINFFHSIYVWLTVFLNIDLSKKPWNLNPSYFIRKKRQQKITEIPDYFNGKQINKLGLFRVFKLSISAS